MSARRLTTLIAVAQDLRAGLSRLERAFEVFDRHYADVAQWLRVEISVAPRTRKLLLALEPTQRLLDLFAALEAAGLDEGRVQRTASTASARKHRSFGRRKLLHRRRTMTRSSVQGNLNRRGDA